MIGPETQKMIDRFNVATSRVGARIRQLIEDADLTPEEAEAFGAVATELEEMGASATDPFPIVVTVNAATWDEQSRTLSAQGAFQNYSPSSGEVFVPAGGTGVNAGVAVAVESKRDANTVVLSGSIGADANGQSDVFGAIRTATSASKLRSRRS